MSNSKGQVESGVYIPYKRSSMEKRLNKQKKGAWGLCGYGVGRTCEKVTRICRVVNKGCLVRYCMQGRVTLLFQVWEREKLLHVEIYVLLLDRK